MSAEKLGTEIRREQITRAALELISHQGLRNLSVASVARRIGLVPSALYRHFEDKDEMLDSVLDLIRKMLLRNVGLVKEETANPLERLKRLLFRHIQLIRENRGIPRIIFSEDVYAGHPERKMKIFESIKAYLHQVEKIVHQGQAEGQIRADIDPGTISIMFLGLIQPAAILWHLSDGHFDVTKHAEKAYRVFHQAIAIWFYGRWRRSDCSLILLLLFLFRTGAWILFD